MSTEATPPGWAEALLRIVLRPGDFDTVSGDLLEEYRESIHPARGPRRADLWYVTQVFGFVSPGARLFGALFGAAFVARTALDWLSPPPLDFHTRASVSTERRHPAGDGILGGLALRLVRRRDSRRGRGGCHRRRGEYCGRRCSAGDLARSGDDGGRSRQRWFE